MGAHMVLSASQLEVGAEHEVVVVEDLTRTQIVQYAGASDDYNPVHTDEVYAREVVGYPTVFAHGMLTMGITGRAVTDFVGNGRLREFGVRFARQVWPGDALTVRMRVQEVRQVDGRPVVDLEIVTTNQDGHVVVSGTATADLDD